MPTYTGTYADLRSISIEIVAVISSEKGYYYSRHPSPIDLRTLPLNSILGFPPLQSKAYKLIKKSV